MGLETLTQGLQNCVSLLCHNKPREHPVSAGNTRVKSVEVLLSVKGNHSVLHAAPQRGKATLTGMNPSTHRTSVGLST